MAGYFGTPLAQQLGIKPGARLMPVRAPGTMERELAPRPPETSFHLQRRRGALRRHLAVLPDAADLAAHFPVTKRLQPAGGLWVAWPKKSCKVAADLDEQRVREGGLAGAPVDNKVCTVDELRFVYRVANRPRSQDGRARVSDT